MPIATKHCPRCGRTKPVTQFHQHRRTSDGRQPYCAACNNSVTNALHAASPLERMKRAARTAVNRAKRRGELIEGPCLCGPSGCEGAIQAHHPDYTQPLSVEWLCVKHHGEANAAQRRAQKVAA